MSGGLGVLSRVPKALVMGLGWLTDPGMIVGGLVGGCMDISGATTNWAWLRGVEDSTSMVANFAIYPAVWLALQYAGRNTPSGQILRVLLGLWSALAVCMFGLAVILGGG